MKQFVLSIASIYGALAVIFGAFGAHLLKNKISVEKLISFETGVRYQMFHALLLLIIGLQFQFNSGLQKTFAWFIILGIFLFSFSIYGLSLQELVKMNIKFLGPITPLGGFLLILGWVLLFVYFIKST
jgi:uncharacterized membrane protein YgdD (TMEM256/DUF423 family)